MSSQLSLNHCTVWAMAQSALQLDLEALGHQGLVKVKTIRGPQGGEVITVHNN